MLARTSQIMGSLTDPSLRSNRTAQSRAAGNVKETSVEGDDISHATVSLNDQEGYPSSVGTCLSKMCLRPKWSVRNQLFISFGFVTFISLFFIVITAILTAVQAGKSVKKISANNLNHWADGKVELSSKYVADTISQKLQNFESLCGILLQITQDRFEGYPSAPGYLDDSAVPFTNEDTGEKMYPLNGSLIPIEWKTKTNFVANSSEHHQGRWVDERKVTSTASASIGFQGACDPDETDPNSTNYYAGCTAENNNIETGGNLQPTETFQAIHSRVSDFATAIFKPVYEYHADISDVGIYFSNSGAGATTFFPSTPLNGSKTYKSEGCAWMLENHPLDETRKIGSPEDVERCHPEGAEVSLREYNPLERGWCRDQALNPGKVMIEGPSEDGWNEGGLRMFIGQAVYDRTTKNFIACTLVTLTQDEFKRIIGLALGVGGIESADTRVALMRWDDTGTVVVADESVGDANTASVSDLSIGIDEDDFKMLKAKFYEQYTETWNKKAATFATRSKNNVYVSVWPIPNPPDVYDPTYEPDFMILTFIDESSILENIDSLDDEVDEEVEDLIKNLLIAGCLGLVLVTSVIYVVSLYLTKPLIWMNKVGDEIVNNFGTLNSDTIQYHQSRWVRFAPKTEITDLVDQFQVMVQRFSGNGVAKLVKKKPSEVRNPFNLLTNFDSVYSQRAKEGFKYRYEFGAPKIERGLDKSTDMSDRSMTAALARVHIGQIVKRTGGGPAFAHALQEDLDDAGQNKKVTSSPLFWWILGAITVLLLLAMIGISVMVTMEISRSFPGIAKKTGIVYVDFESSSLLPLAKLRAAYAAEVMFAPIRDLHLLTRISAWLLFGGLQRRSTSFPTLNMAAEECKPGPGGECEFLRDKNKALCDCKWDDKWGSDCYDYSFDTRTSQRVFLEGQSQDVSPNGDRNHTSFPDLAFSTATTNFWPGVKNVPGAEKGDLASGYETTYDQMRAMSALSMIHVPLYNYYIKDSQTTRPLGTYVGLEAGGLYTGYAGCFHEYADFSNFTSNDENNAYKINNNLCPKGKYGYDPRCRSWYATGKRIAEESEGDQLHVTPPYIFAGVDKSGTSATQPLIDPATGEHVGQTLIDFSTNGIIEALTEEETSLMDGFPVLMNVMGGDLESDAIVAPGLNFTGFSATDIKGRSVENFVVPYGEDPDSSFSSIVEDMRSGGSGNKIFTRLKKNGETEEFYFAYAPVQVKSFRPVDSSNITRGVEQYQSTVFSLGLAESVSAVRSTFESIEESMEYTTKVAVSIMSILITLAFLSVLYVSSRVAVSIITPVAQLLALVTKINGDEINEELPSIAGGSSEVSRVHLTFERLHMVVRFANTAFYSGDLSKAYGTLTEALGLFTKLNNSKAMGVANNNLGNTMLTMYRTMKKTGAPTICGLTKDKLIAKGIAYFDSTIDSGEKALAEINEAEGWSTNYLVFMQQLSNRYFNRAMFLLTVKEDHPFSNEAESQGFMDLSTTKDMDREVVDNGDMQGFKGDLDVYFDLLMCRIRGILLLMEMGHEDEWGIEELFDDAFAELNSALKNPNNGLFTDLAPAAQMQRLDAALIAYYRLSKNKDRQKGAEIAIRMLVEDEYVLGEAALSAIMALIEYVTNLTAADLGGEDPSNVRSTLFQFRRLISDTLSICKYGRDVMHRESFRQSNMGDFSMEIF